MSLSDRQRHALDLIASYGATRRGDCWFSGGHRFYPGTIMALASAGLVEPSGGALRATVAGLRTRRESPRRRKHHPEDLARRLQAHQRGAAL